MRVVLINLMRSIKMVAKTRLYHLSLAFVFDGSRGEMKLKVFASAILSAKAGYAPPTKFYTFLITQLSHTLGSGVNSSRGIQI